MPDMENAFIDINSKQTITARLKTDGITIIRLKGDPSGGLEVTTNTAGAVTPKNFSGTDDNSRTSWFAVSETDGVTPVALQGDSTGHLLIKVI